MTDRTPAFPIDAVFTDRWSPRAYDGQGMPHADLLTILEAARWAPSAYNIQPWRILYAERGDAHWETFLGLLVPPNRVWAKDAAALLMILSDSLSGRGEALKPSHTHSFDAGSAWMSLSLQAWRLGYAAHGMSGVDFAAVPAALGIPARYRVEAAAAIGRPADASVLPEDLRAKEVKSDRKPLAEIAFAGRFPAESG